MTTFRLPDLGEGLQEAEIVAWHVAAGDHVAADQPLLSVETEKAVVEIPSPQSGRIVTLLCEPGEVVKIGAPLVDFADAARADTGTVVGEIPAEGTAEARPDVSAAPAARGAQVKAAPAIRALARKLGVDLAAVAPTGPGGSITAADVERAGTVLEQAGPLEPLRGVRRTMARRMARAHAEVAPTTVSDEADIEAWPETEDPTMRLVRAVCAGCAAEPALNVWYDSREEGRRLHSAVHIGVAMDTSDGLFVPVLRDAGRRGIDELPPEFAAMRQAVQLAAYQSASGSISPKSTVRAEDLGDRGGRHSRRV